LRDYKLYLHDIKEAVEKIETFTKGFTFEKFAEDIKTVDAVQGNGVKSLFLTLPWRFDIKSPDGEAPPNPI